MPFDRGNRSDLGPLSIPVDPELDSLEIELDDGPEELAFEVQPDGSLTELLGGGLDSAILVVPEWNDNLALFCDDNYLDGLAQELSQAYESDRSSCDEWLKNYTNSLDLLGLKVDERNEPWPGASGVYHPMLAEALVRYVSEAALETYPTCGPAETSVLGNEDTETMKRAARVKAEMNYQCLKKMPEDRAEFEMTLWRQGLAGICYRKVYYDRVLKRPKRIMVPGESLIFQYGTSDLWTCPRYTYAFTERVNDVRKKIAVKMYRPYDPIPSTVSDDETTDKIDEIVGVDHGYYDDDEIEMLEMYVDLDLQGFEHGEGVELPYIVTIDKTTGTVVSIYRNHRQETPFLKRSTYFVPWKYLPGFGLHGTGLCQLLGGTADAATSLTRQMIDAGTISNVPSGFKSRNLRILGDDKPLRPGELRDVDVMPGMIRQCIEWAPTKDPSPVFVALLQEVTNEGRRIGSVSDMKVGEGGGAGATGATLAVIERHMRIISAVQARNNASMAEELDMLKIIIAEEMPDEYDYSQAEPASRRADFASTNIIPVADPSATTMSQRIMRYTAAEQIASRQPHLYDMARLHRQMMEQLQIPNADKIVPLQDDFVPQDPVTENMRSMRMQPVKAFINQDHEAHLAAHMAAAQDPMIAQVIGQGPNAAAIQAAAAAHIQEHVAFAYRAKMQAQLGFALPDPDATLPPDQEAALSRFIAEGSKKVLSESQAQAAQQKAQQEAQDPMIQLRKLELELKAEEMKMESETEDKKMATEFKIAELRARVELAKIKAKQQELAFSEASKATAHGAEIASRERIAKAQQDKAKNDKSNSSS